MPIIIFLAVIFAGCGQTPEIISKDYKNDNFLFGTHHFSFDIHLENIRNFNKASNLIGSLIYQNKNFDEYIAHIENEFTGKAGSEDYPPMINEDGTEYFYDSEVIMSYKIEYYNNSFVIVLYESYIYHSNGAHGNTKIRYFIIDIKEEKILGLYEISNQIPEDILSRIIKEKYDINYYLREEIWPPDTININNDNVELIWNTYSITPYSDGIIHIEIPKETAKPYLTEKGRALTTSITDKNNKREK
ncbi:MAG: RsiV family protein [Treponema sp.]|jgi:hypothetical protein|nr:RsiV family protein [Treponema sp.]